jgi:DNA-binding NtrC family response regulator
MPVSMHPVVRGYAETDRSLRDILVEASVSGDPLLEATRLLLDGIEGSRSIARGLRAARQMVLRGVDSDLSILFLSTWAQAALLHQTSLRAGTSEARALMDQAHAMRGQRTRREVVAYAALVASRISRAEGNHARREEELRAALPAVRPPSPRRGDVLLELAWALAEAGRLCELVPPFAPGAPGRTPSPADVSAVRFADAVEAGRVTAASALLPTLDVALLRREAAHYVESCRLLLGFLTADASVSPAAATKPDTPDWALCVLCLLGGRTRQALRWARMAEKTHPAAATARDFASFNLIRAELAEGNAEAARRLIAIRRGKGNTHYLDDLFLARADLLAARREAAVSHVSSVFQAAETRDALGRVRFELRLSHEIPRDMLTDLVQDSARGRAAIAPPTALPAPHAAQPGDSVRRGPARLIGVSSAMDAVRRDVARLADLDIPLLITGETGTGKELVAQALHEASRRAGGPFVAVNCGAISESLLESELFGHDRGAFTGAASSRRGLFEEAGDGTILLDEIGDVSPRLQVALLRVLESGEIRPVGGSQVRLIRCRILASTNADLDRLTGENRFRKDLFFRLCRLRIHLPPLRERLEDVLPLAEHFLNLGRAEGSRAAVAPDLARSLMRRDWPGNVRELRSLLERARLLNSDKLSYNTRDVEDGSESTASLSHASSEGPVASPVVPDAPPIRLRPESIRPGGAFRRGQAPVRRMESLREIFARQRLLTRAELVANLGVSPNTATRYLQALVREGLIRRVAPTASPRSVYFALAGEGPAPAAPQPGPRLGASPREG